MRSAASLDVFLNRAWSFLQDQEQAPAKLSVRSVLNALYTAAAAPPGVKDTLGMAPLFASMAAYVANTGGLKAKLQSAPPAFTPLKPDDLTAYYGALAQDPFAVPRNAWEVEAKFALPVAYMHVFQPRAQPPTPDSRIALNVLPLDIAEAVKLGTALLYAHEEIYSIKYLGPGAGSKCDSMLAYLKKNENYAAIRQRFVDAASRLRLQAGAGLMWDEDPNIPGLAEAMEPPPGQSGIVSFTNYRCLVIYLAYKTYMQGKPPQPSFAGFKGVSGAVLRAFGVDPAAPHLQGPLDPSLAGTNKRYFDLYLDYRKAWVGQ